MDFILRNWQIEDLDNLVGFANNMHIARNMTDSFPYPYTEEKGKAFIAFATGELPNRILAIDIDRLACGSIGLHPQQDIQRKNAELGYWLAEPYWGNGIMSRAITQMVAYGFKHWDINRIFARPFGTNLASQRALEKAGFILEGRFEKTFFKNEVFVDELIYAIRKT